MTEEREDINFTTYDDDVVDEAPVRRERAPRTMSNLDRLREIMAKETAIEPVEIFVPLRPGLSFDIDVETLTMDRLERYQKQCVKKVNGNRRMRRQNKDEGEIDNVHLASLVIHNHIIAIKVNGEVVPESEEHDRPMLITDPDFLSMLDVITTDDVVAVMVEIFGSDLHLLDAFQQIQEYIAETTEFEEGDDNPLKG